MAVFNSAVLTARGNELLVDAVAGDKIIFTRMVVGRGEYSDGERERNALEKMTALKDVVQEFTFSGYKKVSAQCVLLTSVISNLHLDHSYKITEIGIYGKRVQDESDFLCSVAVTKSLDESDTFPPYNGLQECQIVQDYYITISPDAEVSVNTQGACVLREEFEQIKQTIYTELDALKEKMLCKDGDGSDLTVDFKTATERENIKPKTKLSVIMGIISRVIADLKSGAFADVINNLLATQAGGVLDARQGKVLKDMIEAIKQDFQAGCNVLVSTCTTYGATPESNSPQHIAAAIGAIYNKRYNDGYGAGRLQGQKDVIADPGAFGIQVGFTIEQMKIDISSPIWSDGGGGVAINGSSKLISFTAPNDGILIVNNNIAVGIGISYMSYGTFTGNVKYKGSIIHDTTYSSTNDRESSTFTIIPAGSQYPLKAGESISVNYTFTGYYCTDYTGGKQDAENIGCVLFDAITWVHIYV